MASSRRNRGQYISSKPMTELHCLLRVQFDKIGSSKLIGCAWCLYLEAENINFSAVFESNTEMGIIKTEKKIKKQSSMQC